MKVLAILTFMLAIFAAPAYAQQQGTVSMALPNELPPQTAQGAGLAQSPSSTQPPAKAKTYHHVRRHTPSKHSAS